MNSDSLESEKNLYSLIGKWEPASLREEIYGFVYWKPPKGVTLANSAGPDDAAFHQGLHCLRRSTK